MKQPRGAVENELLALLEQLDARQRSQAAGGGGAQRVQMTWDGGHMKTVADMLDDNVGTFESFGNASGTEPHARGYLLLSPDHRQMRLVTKHRWLPQSRAWEDAVAQETVHIDAKNQRYTFDVPKTSKRAPHLQFLGGGGAGTFAGKVVRAA